MVVIDIGQGKLEEVSFMLKTENKESTLRMVGELSRHREQQKVLSQVKAVEKLEGSEVRVS